MNTYKHTILLVSTLLFLISFTSQAHAITILGNGPWGDYTADLSYSYDENEDEGTLRVDLENTSDLDNGGYLTAFVFNNPGNRISGASLDCDDSDFGLLGDPDFDNGIIGQPYGLFDIGASTSDSFQGGKGGGAPSKGIAAGNKEIFTFIFTGDDLDLITDYSFVSEYSFPQGNDDSMEFFAARFRGFDNDKSDKVPGDYDDPHTPEPASLILVGISLLGGAFLKRGTVAKHCK